MSKLSARPHFLLGLLSFVIPRQKEIPNSPTQRGKREPEPESSGFGPDFEAEPEDDEDGDAYSPGDGLQPGMGFAFENHAGTLVV